MSVTELPSFNATMLKFGAPQTIIRQYRHWSVLLRPAQATLGALILAAHEPARALSDLSSASFAELHTVTGQLESALAKAFQYDKINYLMLMMVDPDVHFHVIPRYAQHKTFANMKFIDAGWPAMPDLKQVNLTDVTQNDLIMQHIQQCWL
ncbi:diadenosine tetraphosphate (Ap4A) hydrolase [Nitrosomonas sp. PY1]|uniref:HIT family protein n=1 Tax=Nitrosomonas sp. PY1 TaxID=1803906 RepID=UPI001FC87C5D|nr:HIT family protein [Nitrosomonas sp. PY1]GKS68039.1 diadenosine tetraphosphate (Ap4A) hydrolase [Nitrosomonas sp. PY1]